MHLKKWATGVAIPADDGRCAVVRCSCRRGPDVTSSTSLHSTSFNSTRPFHSTSFNSVSFRSEIPGASTGSVSFGQSPDSVSFRSLGNRRIRCRSGRCRSGSRPTRCRSGRCRSDRSSSPEVPTRRHHARAPRPALAAASGARWPQFAAAMAHSRGGRPAATSRGVEVSGWRDSRSIGPDTDTAAMTLPDGERTGADTDATPGLRSATDCDQPRRRTVARATAEKRGRRQPALMLRILPSQQDLGRRAGAHRQLRPHRDRVPQPGRTPAAAAHARRRSRRRNSRRLAGDVAQSVEHGPGRRQQAILASAAAASSVSRGPRTKRPGDRGSRGGDAQRDGETVRGGPGEPRRGSRGRPASVPVRGPSVPVRPYRGRRLRLNCP